MVAHIDQPPIAAAAQAHLNGGAIGAVAQGVIEQVEQGPVQPGPIAPGRAGGGAGQGQADLALLRQGPQAGPGRLHQLPQLHRGVAAFFAGQQIFQA